MSNIEKSSLNTLDPIFVHSGFRTSSTWFWKKFRSFTDIIPYYEPFHEIISNINDYHPDNSYTNTWRSHHPSSAPYFMEYSVIPALKANPKLFNPSISLQTFIPSGGLEGELTSEEKAYIQCLIDNAHQYSKQPGFMFTRSLGRALAIKKSFGGKSIFLHRNLFHQWASYSGQNIRGNNYFIDRLEETVQFATHDPFLKALDEWFKDRQPAADNINTFILFIVFHLYIYISAFKSADVIINSTEISHNIKARQQTEADLFQLLGKEISLADARNVFDISFVNIKKPEILTETLDYFMKIISGIVSDQACLSFIEKARNDTITEWEKNEFYTKEMRSILLDKNIENSKIQQERHHELEIRDHRLHELDQAVQQRDAQLQELQQNVQQRDHHLHELNQAVQQRDTQLQELQHNLEQRDHHLHELIQTVQQRDAQLQELQQNVQQRDHHLHELIQTVQQRDAQLQELQQNVQQRDHRLHELDKTIQQHGTRLQQLQHNLQQRDHHLHELIQTVQQRDTQLQELQQNLQQRDHHVHELSQTVQQRDTQLQELQQNLEQRDHHVHELSQTVQQREAQLQDKKHDLQEYELSNQHIKKLYKSTQYEKDKFVFGTLALTNLFSYRGINLVSKSLLIGARKAARKGRWRTAVSYYEEFLRQNPINSHAWTQLGHAKKELGEWKPAVEAYAIAQIIVPTDEDINTHLSQAIRHITEETTLSSTDS